MFLFIHLRNTWVMVTYLRDKEGTPQLESYISGLSSTSIPLRSSVQREEFPEEESCRLFVRILIPQIVSPPVVLVSRLLSCSSHCADRVGSWFIPAATSRLTNRTTARTWHKRLLSCHICLAGCNLSWSLSWQFYRLVFALLTAIVVW